MLLVNTLILNKSVFTRPRACLVPPLHHTYRRKLLGDEAYSFRAILTHLRSRRIRVVIPEPADQRDHCRRRGPAAAGRVGPASTQGVATGLSWG